MKKNYKGHLAQLVEHLVYTEEVGGSSPSVPTIKIKNKNMKYAFFIVLLIFGFIMVWKSNKFLDFFGRMAFADKAFGFYGGTRMFYKLLGVTLMILSALMVTGVLEKIIVAIFSPLSGGGK